MKTKTPKISKFYVRSNDSFVLIKGIENIHDLAQYCLKTVMRENDFIQFTDEEKKDFAWAVIDTYDLKKETVAEFLGQAVGGAFEIHHDRVGRILNRRNTRHLKYKIFKTIQEAVQL